MKCTAWVAISKHGIIGPFWFESDVGDTVTVNKERYIVALNKFWRTLCTHRGVQRKEQWFQQDGATPHTVNITMEWLDRRFAGRLISRYHVPDWSLHSLDLNKPNFYLCGFLKEHVYQSPQKVAKLKEAVTQQIRGIAREEYVRVISKFARRFQVCHQRRGTHLEHVL